jgi:hypothetical protein
MPLTLRALNRATLARQLLLERQRLDVADAVRRVGPIQAQEPASPYLALWNRVRDFDPSALDAAFAAGTVVKASLFRITLHAVHADDYPLFHDAVAPALRAVRQRANRFTTTAPSPEAVDAILPELLAFATTPRSRSELDTWLAARLGHPDTAGMWALRAHAPMLHVATGGPWSFGLRPAYVAAPGRIRDDQGVRSLAVVVTRYLEAFGPASLADIAQFTKLSRTAIREAIRELGAALTMREGPAGAELVDLPDHPLPAKDTAAPPRLLPMWDSLLLAYADRSRVIPPAYRKAVIRSNGDVLPTLLVDGEVAGVWRAFPDGIEATAFHRLDDETWQGLTDEARALRGFLGKREPLVYGRYRRWWAALPATEVRVLAD